MLIFNCLTWWYGSGWAWRLQGHLKSLKTLSEYFSVEALLRTLFAPYRQTLVYDRRQKNISNLGSRLLDGAVSRCVGFLYRSSLLFMACLLALGEVILFILSAVVWPLIPLLPLLAVVLYLKGGHL